MVTHGKGFDPRGAQSVDNAVMLLACHAEIPPRVFYLDDATHLYAKRHQCKRSQIEKGTKVLDNFAHNSNKLPLQT